VEQGLNLSGCRMLIAGGGIVGAASAGAELAQQALGRLPNHVLAPRHCQVIVDRRHVLAAAGLLAQSQPQIAEALLRRELPEEPADESQ
jgi:MutL protein